MVPDGNATPSVSTVPEIDAPVPSMLHPDTSNEKTTIEIYAELVLYKITPRLAARLYAST